MSASSFRKNFTGASFLIADPGDGAALPTRLSGIVPISVTSGAETNTLGLPLKAGLDLTLNMVANAGTSRAVTVTGGYDESSSTVLTFTSAASYATLRSFQDTATSFIWRLTDYDNVTGPTVLQDTVQSETAFTLGTTGLWTTSTSVPTFSCGDQANTSGSGIAVTNAKGAALTIRSDDNNTNIAGNARGIQSRFLVTTNASGSTIRALQGQMKLTAGTDVATGIYTANQGYIELMGATTVSSGATFSCFDASLEIAAGTVLTTASGGEAAGIHIETTGTGTITNNGTCAGVLVTNASGAADWPHGIYIDNSAAAVGIFVGTTSGNSIQVTNATLTVGDNTSGVRVAVTAAASSNAYGMSGYFDATITGTTAGHSYGLGSWINTATTPVLSSGHIIVPFEGGVYTGEAQASARIVLCQLQAILNGAPNSLHVFRVNTTQTTTAVIAAANAGSIGYTAGAGTAGTQLGYIPIADIVGTGVVYIRVYDSAS